MCFWCKSLDDNYSELQVISIWATREQKLRLSVRATQTHGKVCLGHFCSKWSVVFASQNISRRLLSASRGTGGLLQSNRPVSFGYVICLMWCRSYWILCTSCLACWLLKMADRVSCYVCMFWPANVRCSVVCLRKCCLNCYYCTVPLFIVRCSPVADWCRVNDSCKIVFVSCVMIGPARSSCLLSMLLSFCLSYSLSN